MPTLRASRLSSLGTFAVLALAIGCGGGEPSDPPRPRATDGRPAVQPDLARRVADRARILSPTTRVERTDERHVQIGEGTLDVSNLGEECRRAPDACDEAIDRYVRSAIEPTASATREAVRAVLLPVEAATAAREEAAARGGDEPLVGRPFAGRLFEAFVLDEPDRIVHLTSQGLRELGDPTLEELHQLALANMRRVFPDALPHEPFSDRAPDVRVVRTGDSYENSRVLLHERWAPIARQVRGDLLVAAPARDAVVFTGAASERDVAALRWLAQQMAENEPHPISPAVLRWTEGGWELFHANDRPDPAVEELLRGAP